ncbi:hypothetical protein AQUCO_00700600v1 [Aquilegia coerulea]|uniref:Uncharacterized protein n=1 Tax=Aquilegia coerulea TaxID=218851 RepID=A0A2G5EKV3_AQUCA|nr:hypothetical protein AQUCO_00700600v1 [Aquilegia coerulea]
MRIHITVLQGLTRENPAWFCFTLILPWQIFVEPNHSFVTNPDCLPGSNIYNGLVICWMISLVAFPLSSLAASTLKWISKINDPPCNMVDVTKSMTRCGLLVISVVASVIGFEFMIAIFIYGMQYHAGTWNCFSSTATLTGIIVLAFIIPAMKVFSVIWHLTS